MKHYISALFFMFSWGVLFTQTELSLEQCISYAWEHNLDIEEGELNKDAAQSQLQESRLGRLPNISANSNLTKGVAQV